MLPLVIGIRGYINLGNNEQVLKLKIEGELILLVGDNGAGKSSLLDSFDYTLYGKTRGRKEMEYFIFITK
jgi:DNA repair exonuclease SbcCD ATPase subunit